MADISPSLVIDPTFRPLGGPDAKVIQKDPSGHPVRIWMTIRAYLKSTVESRL